MELIQKLEELRDLAYKQYHTKLESSIKNGATIGSIVNNSGLTSTEKLIMIDLILNLSDTYKRKDCYERMNLQRIMYNSNVNRLIEKGWLNKVDRNSIEINRIF